MLVVQNKVKKGIEIPFIDFQIGNDFLVFPAIDKNKYAEWLHLNNSSYRTIYVIYGDENVTNLKYRNYFYEGDELIVNKESPMDIVYSLFIEYNINMEF